MGVSSALYLTSVKKKGEGSLLCDALSTFWSSASSSVRSSSYKIRELRQDLLEPVSRYSVALFDHELCSSYGAWSTCFELPPRGLYSIFLLILRRRQCMDQSPFLFPVPRYSSSVALDLGTGSTAAFPTVLPKALPLYKNAVWTKTGDCSDGFSRQGDLLPTIRCADNNDALLLPSRGEERSVARCFA